MKRLMLMLVALCALPIPAAAAPPLIFEFVGADNQTHVVVTMIPDNTTFEQYSDLCDLHLIKCLAAIEAYL